MKPELITALKAATGPDRKLDREIAMLLEDVECEPFKYDLAWNHGWGMYYAFDPVTVPGEPYQEKVARTAPHYTGSIDAAITTIPEGCWIEGVLNSPAFIECHSPTVYEPVGIGKAPTLPLAILIANMEARL